MIKRLGLIALLVAGTLTACGKDDVRPASSGDPTTSTTATTASTTSTTAAAAATTTLKASEYAYAGTNLTFAPGALTVTLDNGGKEEHQATIVRFKAGKTIADLSAVAASDPGKLDTVVDVFGGPNAVAPGGSQSSTQTLEAGDYYFMCFIPAADGQPHAAKGMVAPFKVEGAAPAETPAASDKTIDLKEYAFGTADGGIEAGTYTFENKGEQLHEAAIYKPADGKTTQDVIDYFKNPNPSGPPPVVPAGGIAALNAGSSVTADLVAGEYVFMCFLPDRADGAPHFTKGMIQAVTVT